MRDKRPVDELSIEELERILAIRKRQARQKRLRRLDRAGRRVAPDQVASAPPNHAAHPMPAPVHTAPSPDDAAFPADDGIPHFEDGLAPEQVKQAEAEERSTFLNMVWNRTLVLVEVLAFVGLVVIGVEMIQALQVLQAETAAVQAEAQAQAFASIPTPSPTPEITLDRIVLPSGHTPPTSPGGAQFNLNEIPEHLRPVVQQQLAAAPIAIPTPGPESPIRIEIPRLNLDASVVSGTDWEALKRGVGHQSETGLPGQSGNIVFSAHNDIYGELFRHLDELQPGDEVIIHTRSQRYTYVVRETQIVSPYAVHVMESTRDPTATLISCYPYQVDNQRIVVFTELQDNS